MEKVNIEDLNRIIREEFEKQRHNEPVIFRTQAFIDAWEEALKLDSNKWFKDYLENK